MSNSDLHSTREERRQAEIVSRHLDPSYTADFEGGTSDTRQSPPTTTQMPNGQDQESESSLNLQGGDIHRDLYKIVARANPLQRARTLPHISRPDAAVQTAGEHSQPAERQPLLGRRREWGVASAGGASITRTFFLLLKSFIGTGVLFLPKAFKNGGLLFSLIALVTVSLVSYIGIRLLLQRRARYGGGYGDFGQAIGGAKMRSIILSSITISQIGFVCAATIFTAENLNELLLRSCYQDIVAAFN